MILNATSKDEYIPRAIDGSNSWRWKLKFIFDHYQKRIKTTTLAIWLAN